MVRIEENLKGAIRSIPDYPKKGVVFRDLTTLWKDPKMMKLSTDAIYTHWRKKKIDKVMGIEARGFIVGAPLADRLGVGFVPARKLGKLPFRTFRMDYELEYGKEGLEVHSDAISKGERVLIVDDLLATGGTAQAAMLLVEKLGGKVVGFSFVAELASMKGREKLAGHEVHTLVRYATD